MKKTKSRSKKSKLTLDKIAPKALIAILVVFIALFAVQFISNSNAAKPVRAPKAPSVYLTPNRSSSSVGANVVLELRENSGTVPVNAFEVLVDYPNTVLELVGFAPNQAVFDVAAEYSATTGMVTITRGSTAQVTGDQLIGTLTFKVISKGNANVVVNQNSTLITPNSTDQDIGNPVNIASTPESKGSATIRINK
jgi:hypothetical protein